ncbi:MAG: TAXI family TRAP transporter solute-binding subunit [Pseudomonadota bacterium]
MRLGVLALTLGLSLISIWWLARDLAPPRSLVFAAGTEGGGYWQFAEAYRARLAADGIDVVLRPTAGSVENAALLAARAADVALIQGGIETEPTLTALGAMFQEPVFIFARRASDLPRNIAAWQGVSVAMGAEGSGTRAAVDRLMRALNLPDGAVLSDPRGGSRASAALVSGAVDAAVFVAPLTAPYLKPLFENGDLVLLELDHLRALSRLLPQSQVIALPSGALSMQPPVPGTTRRLLALRATLAAQPDLHPALIDRLIEAARVVHDRRDAITDAGDFPSVAGLALPVSAQARDLIVEGSSPLQAYLPYWIVAQIDRVAILLVPALFLLLPLLRLLPAVYAWQMRHRVVRHYTSLREIEDTARDAPVEKLSDLAERLDRIEADIAETKLPLHYRQVAYTARVHIDLLRTKIAERQAQR